MFTLLYLTLKVKLNKVKKWKIHVSFKKRIYKVIYRKISIDRPGGIHFFSTHNFWTTCHRTKIKAYSDRKVSTLSEYVFIFVLLCMIQKLCVDKKWIPPGLSIEILRYITFIQDNYYKKYYYYKKAYYYATLAFPVCEHNIQNFIKISLK